MKKTCYGCKALQHYPNVYCSLNYKIDVIYKFGVQINGKPLQECPKPKTNKRLYEIKQEDYQSKKEQ